MLAPTRTGASRRSRRLPRVIALLTAVVTCALSFLAAAPAQAAIRFVKAVPVCSDAPSGQASCYAMKLVPATRGEAGARPAATPSPSAVVNGPAGGYTPAALTGAYAVSRTTPTTQVVAVVDAHDDPNVRADLNAFDAKYGFPAETTSTFRVVNQHGAASPLPTADAGWAGEISLDVQAVRGMCAQCKIILVEADDATFTNLGVAENKAVALGATIVTNSFGATESATVPTSYAAAFRHSGVVITASTGDHGFDDWDHVNTGGSSANKPSIPAAFLGVVAVGGTTLDLDNLGARADESVWNENGTTDHVGYNLRAAMGASGGGCSTLYTVSAWQKAVPGYSTTGCGSKRMVGDVAALADPYTGYDVYDSYQSTGWQTFGGTSLASPLIAGIWALAGGGGGVDYPAKTLYAHYAAGAPTYDVRVGGNGACGGASTTSCSAFFGGSPNVLGAGRLDCAWLASPSTALASQNGQCNAKVGFDGPSGVGTPNGLALFQP